METNDRAGLALALSLARAGSQEVLKPLRPGPERADHRVRPLGHVGQGHRRHAGGFQHSGGLQLGQSRENPKPAATDRIPVNPMWNVETRA